MIERVKALAALLAVAGLLTTACGSGAGPASTGPDGATALTVGSSPNLGNAGLYYAHIHGVFKRHKLDVTLSPVQSGAAAVPLLLNGQLGVAASDPVAAIVSASKNVPVTIIAPGPVGPTDPAQDSTGLLVKANGSIRSVKDLEGRTIAVVGLNGLSQISTRRAIDKNGGDSSKVKFVELPMQQMVEAMDRGQVDGAVVNEPFTTQGLQSGLGRLLSPITAAVPGVPTTLYISSKPYVRKNPGAIAAFSKALTEANTFLAGHPDTIREVGHASTQTPPEVLSKIVLPVFNDKPVDRNALQTLIDLMVQYKVIPAPVNLDTLITGSS